MGDGERRWTRPDSNRLVAALIVSAAVAELWMAWHWFGFLTGDEVEVLAEAFRVATGYEYHAWDIRNLFVPHFIVAPVIWLATKIGVHDIRTLIVIASLPFVIANACSTLLVERIARMWSRDARVSLIAAALFALHWIPLAFAGTVYPRTLATACVLGAAFLLWSRQGHIAALFAGALAAIAFTDRYSEIVFLAPLLLVARRRWWSVLLGFAVIAILTIGIYDAVTWGNPFSSLYNFAHLTIVESDFSSRLKHQSAAWYLTSLPRWLAPSLLPLLWFARRERTLLLFALIPLLALSIVHHKELRYLHGVIPWLMLLAALGFMRMPWRRTAMTLLALSMAWQLSGVRYFARKSMPAVEAAQALAHDPGVKVVVVSQLWAYGDRLYFGDRISAPRDVGTPPVRLAVACKDADAVCLYESDIGELELKILREGGFTAAQTFRRDRARDVVVFRRLSRSVSDTSGRARRSDRRRESSGP